MLKKIALVTLTAAALVAPPSLVHALGDRTQRRQRERQQR